MTKDELIKIALSCALAYDLDPALVCAVIETESSWNPWSIRYEPEFYGRYTANQLNQTRTERTLRATSIGLMQVMGQVAREQGCTSQYLTELLDPATGCIQGCVKLKSCLLRANGNVTAALLFYNGGSDVSYPARVMSHYQSYAYLNSATRQPE